MADDKLLNTLQEEIKLMKGELKQSLASVRDYLLNMELPSSEISNILTELGGSGESITMKGSLETPKEDDRPEDPLSKSLEDEEAADTDDLLDLEDPQEEVEEETLETEETEETEEIPEDITETEEEPSMVEEETPAAEEELIPEEELQPEMSEEEQEPTMQEVPLMDTGNNEEMNLSVPKVNMLANLINWVARANKEIGKDNIETFLEVYGISGHLSQELKEVILRLSDIAEQATDITSSTEIWSQAMLLLHGILTGGDAPLHPAIPAWSSDEKAVEEEIIEVDKPKDNSVKLKLVLPDEDGVDKEFCINLTPEANGNGNSKFK